MTEQQYEVELEQLSQQITTLEKQIATLQRQLNEENNEQEAKGENENKCWDRVKI